MPDDLEMLVLENVLEGLHISAQELGSAPAD